MNFIAGFFYILTKDEALSFQLLRHVINRFEMSDLFNTDTQKLK